MLQTSPQSAVDAPADGAGRFLGRTHELRDVAQLLEQTRLVTLTGAPGVGKTRLAAELADRHDETTWLVELAPVRDAPGVARAVAAALSVQETAGRGLVDALAERLRAEPGLLVLDNCEHLLAASAELADALLAACPSLRVLATSREPLGACAGELTWQVPPLSLPEPDLEASPSRLLEYEAVALFVERAAVAHAGFALTSYVAPDVVEICRRLDGIALAIELAAARVGTFTPAEILQRLDDRFGLLTKGGRGMQPGSHTLEAALDWSYEALADPERALLRRLSVFASSFDAEAAREVCAGDPVERAEVAQMLAALVSKSLVDAERDPAPPGRLRLLETIRAYAAARLDDADETAAARAAHAAFHVALAERAEPELAGPEQETWLDRLELARPDVRSALGWSLSAGHGEWALRMAGALVLFWRVRGQFSEGREVLEAALATSGGGAPALEAKACWGAGFLAHMAGDSPGAEPLLERSLAIARRLDDRGACARALLILGNCRQYRDGDAALTLLDESAQLARDAGDAWCLAHALGIAGMVLAYRDDMASARPLFEECLAVAREAGDKQGRRLALIGLGSVAVRQGDFAAAEPLLRECLAVAEELREDYTKAWAHMYLGQLALGMGRNAEARELLDAAIALTRDARSADLVVPLIWRARVAHADEQPERARALLDEALAVAHSGDASPALALHALGDFLAAAGDPDAGRRRVEEALELARAAADRRIASRALSSLGRIARAQGQGGQAAALLREAIELQHEIGDLPGVVESLEALAGLAADSGYPLHGARLLGAADELLARGAYGRSPQRAERVRADARTIASAVTRRELALARAAGAGLAPADAVAHALVGPGRDERPSAGWPSLTEREHEVAALVGAGLTNRQIGERLCVSPWTVKTHVTNIFRKLDLSRRSELARVVSLAGAPPPRAH